MSEKILKFNNIRVNMKEFHNSKQPINLMSVNVDINLNIVAKVLIILLFTEKVKFLNCYQLFYLK